MAQYGIETSEYGNPVRQTDEYGNHIHHQHGAACGTLGDYGIIAKHDAYQNTTTGTTIGSHLTQPYDTTKGNTGAHGGGAGMMSTGVVGGGGGELRRTGSSSSSSSEDDGIGGRRKKGIKENIKELLPGGGVQHEKKGIMEKIKEKLPGHHH